MRLPALGLAALFFVLVVPSSAAADVQWSARLGMGGGSTMGDQPKQFIWENVLRSEVLFGGRGDEHFRIGPALEFRTIDYSTFEMAGGLAVLLPVFRGYPIVLTALAGYALRQAPYGGDGPVFVGTFGWGYRSYDWHGDYQAGLQPYISARVALDDPSRYEITGGIEFDLEYLFVIPYLFFRSLAGRGPPDEPITSED